jgi:hypothetical protein
MIKESRQQGRRMFKWGSLIYFFFFCWLCAHNRIMNNFFSPFFSFHGFARVNISTAVRQRKEGRSDERVEEMLVDVI